MQCLHLIFHYLFTHFVTMAEVGTQKKRVTASRYFNVMENQKERVEWSRVGTM